MDKMLQDTGCPEKYTDMCDVFKRRPFKDCLDLGGVQDLTRIVVYIPNYHDFRDCNNNLRARECSSD